MYNPTRFRSEDHEEAFSLMEKNPLATLVTMTEGRPVINQVPLTPKKTRDGGLELIGHLARANPQWKSMQNSEATAVFRGPQAFITPKWYAQDDVPTWNYLSVQASGRVRLVEDFAGLVHVLNELTQHVEKFWPSGWKFWVPPDLDGENLSRHIVGFRIEVKDLQFKKKLNQNRKPEDVAGVLRGLTERQDEQSRHVLEEMRKIYEPNGLKKP